MRIIDLSSDGCSSDLLARKDDLVADLQPRLAKGAEVDRARPRPRPDIAVAGREPRQADRRQQRPHRQIFAIGNQLRSDERRVGNECVSPGRSRVLTLTTQKRYTWSRTQSTKSA